MNEENLIVKVIGGSLFALLVAFIVGALTVFGVIAMTLGHIFMICAALVGVVIICAQLFRRLRVRKNLLFRQLFACCWDFATGGS